MTNLLTWHRPARGMRAHSQRIDVLVLDADQRQALVCARSLRRAGLTVGAFGPSRWSPAAASRAAAVGGRTPDPERDAEGLARAIGRLVERHEPRVVVPGTDGTVEAIRAHRAELEERTAPALAAEAALAVAVDKERTLACAESIGVPVPRTIPAHDLGAVERAIRELGSPAVVKPAQSWVAAGDGGRRVRSALATTVPEARAVAAPLLALGGDVVVQEWVPGRREAVSLFFAEGRFWGRFAQVAFRMFPPLGGSSVVRESIVPPPDATAFAEELVAAVGLEGYSEVEFRRDADGRPRLMEINPRLSASVEVAVRSGVDFPKLMFAHAAGRPLEAAPAPLVGVRMRWLGGDVRWLRATLREQGRPDVTPAGRAIAQFAFDFLRPAAYDYVDLRDPLPALVATAGFAATALRRHPSPRSAARPEPA